jgi:hypothetical protein
MSEAAMTTPAQADVRSMRLAFLPGMLLVLLSVLLGEAFLAGWGPLDDLRLNLRLGLGAILHLQAILMLFLVGAGAREGHGRLTDLCMALTLAPLARLVSLALPQSLLEVSFLTRLLYVLVPLYIGVIVLVHTRDLHGWQTGLRRPSGRGSASLGFVTLLVVPAAAVGQFYLLDPSLGTPSGALLVFYALILFLLALWQEIVFRGLLIQLGTPAVGAQVAVLLSALWFTALQVGAQWEFSLEVAGVLGLAFVSGYVAAQQARASGSVAVTTVAFAIGLMLYFLVLPRWA